MDIFAVGIKGHVSRHAAISLESGQCIANPSLIQACSANRPVEAAEEFRDELQIDPDNADVQYNLAFVLLQQSQEAEAVDLLRKVLVHNRDHPEANYELGKQLFGSGDATAAIPYLEAAARLRPTFEPVHYQLQAAYRAVGRKEDADDEAKIYRQLKAKSRNITLPPPRDASNVVSAPN